MKLICPICEKDLSRQDKSLVCPMGHRFDIARQGYVNLLTVQRRHSAHPASAMTAPAAMSPPRNTTFCCGFMAA